MAVASQQIISATPVGCVTDPASGPQGNGGGFENDLGLGRREARRLLRHERHDAGYVRTGHRRASEEEVARLAALQLVGPHGPGTRGRHVKVLPGELAAGKSVM